MSRRNNRRNINNNEPLEKEYKDENLTNTETEDFPDDIVDKEPLYEIDKYKGSKDIFFTDNSSMYESNMGTLHFELELENNTFIREKAEHSSTILLVRELDENDSKYLPQILPSYSLAYIPKGTKVTCYEIGNGWYALNKGYIFIGENKPLTKDPKLNSAISKLGTNGLSRMNEVKRHLENGGNYNTDN